MSPFSILRRSPRGRKWNEQQNSRDDVKSPIGTLLRDDIEHDDTDDAETTANSKGRRGGFNKDLLYNLRNRLTGKRTTSQSQPQQEAAAVREMPSFSLSLSLFSHTHTLPPFHSYSHQRQGISSRILPYALQQSAAEIAWMQLQLCSIWWHSMPMAGQWFCVKVAIKDSRCQPGCLECQSCKPSSAC